MKKFIFIITAIISLVIFSCDTAEDNGTAKITLTGTQLGGCFGGGLGKVQASGDTVFFTKLAENELLMSVGLRKNCCAALAHQFDAYLNEITVMVEDTSGRVCRCLPCYYQIDYKIKTESANEIKYKVLFRAYHDSTFTNILSGIYLNKD